MHTHILHLHNHAGWYTQEITASSQEEAIKLGLVKRAGFLEKDYKGQYRIEFDDPNSEFPRFRVIWNDDKPKTFPFGQSSLQKGDCWWSDRFQFGSKEDCTKCGGTGISHYSIFKQCWSCGDSKLQGRGTGQANQRTTNQEKILCTL